MKLGPLAVPTGHTMGWQVPSLFSVRDMKRFLIKVAGRWQRVTRSPTLPPEAVAVWHCVASDLWEGQSRVPSVACSPLGDGSSLTMGHLPFWYGMLGSQCARGARESWAKVLQQAPSASGAGARACSILWKDKSQ